MAQPEDIGSEYDYVIVGAGSAGCTLAYRLSADWQLHVLVIEAGEWSDDPWIRIPLGWGRILQKRLYDWHYFSEPEESIGGRRLECARGKVVGGSSAINAMTYVRGHPSDYDRWAASGLQGWAFADALPYFKRQETWEGGETEFRGGSGPIATRRSRYADPLVDAVIDAAEACGHRRNPDYNAAVQEGFGRLQSTIRKGRRASAAEAYMKPAVARGNVTVLTGAHATRVLFEGVRATGVEFLHRKQKRVAKAGREVVLAGGVINTPQLLMLSGVGDPDALRAHGIDAKLPLRGVGKNLQDHISAAIAFTRRAPGPLVRRLRADRLALTLAQAHLLGTGFATDLPSGVVGFFRTRHAGAAPDAQMLFHAGPMNAAPYLWPFKAAPADGFGTRTVLLRPESRGELRLASADPLAPVLIRQNFLATDRDRAVLREAVRMVGEMFRQPALQPFVGTALMQDFSDAGLDAYIRSTAITVHHPLGTCRMGVEKDPMAVVDRELRVLGAERLRVVDASVMPDLVGGNINAAVVMIAERAADLLRGKPPLRG